jgi:RNA polymerase sigma-70 factor (ECF subfamily)
MAKTEIIVMRQLKKGDASSFERLVAKYERTVYNIIRHFLGPSPDAEDLAQEVFLRVWRSAKTYEPTAKFTTYLYRITANLCLSSIRSRKREPVVSLEAAMKRKGTEHSLQLEDPKASRPESRITRTELADKVREVIAELPENQRMAVILRRYEECSYQEIAEAMGVTTGAVKSLLVRARENIRLKLAPYLAKEGG